MGEQQQDTSLNWTGIGSIRIDPTLCMALVVATSDFSPIVRSDVHGTRTNRHWGQGVVSQASTSQVHHKDMDKVPGKNPPGTSQVHSEFSQPVSLQCPWVRKWLVHSQYSRPCDQGVPIRNIMGTFRMFPVPGSGNGQYICSVPGHVTRMFPSGTPWENPQFSQRKYPELTRVAHSEFPLWCSQQCNHSVPSQ